MFFVVVLSLAALAEAGPVQYDLQRRESEDVNTLPYNFWQQFYLYLTQGTNKNARYFPYNEQEKDVYPFLPYKNMVSYPHSYFPKALNKPDVGRVQPKVDYDSTDLFHLHDVNHHHLVNNIHEVNQKETLRKVNHPYYPYSPITYENYVPNYYNKGYPYFNKHYGKSFNQEYIQPYNYYNKGYPYVNQYYGKSLDQEYIQPYNYYNRYWDLDYIRSYYSRNLDYVKPIISKKFEAEYTKPVIAKSLDVEYVKPVVTESLDVEYIKPVVTKTLDVDYVKPVVTKSLDVEYVKPVITKSLDVEYVKPVITKSLDFEYVKPVVTKSLNVEYIKPDISKNLNLDHVKPIVSQGLEVEYIEPVVSKKLNIEYVKPIIPKSLDMEYQQPTELEFIPDRNSRILNEEYNHGKWAPKNWVNDEGVEDFVSMIRFKRDLNAHVETPVTPSLIDLDQETPVTGSIEMSHQIAKVLNQETPETGNVEVSQQTPVAQVLETEQTSQEGLRQDVQTTHQAEDHIPQEPIHRQKRDFYLFPYYIYVPIQPAVISRTA